MYFHRLVFPSHLTLLGKSNSRFSLDSSSHEERFKTVEISLSKFQLTSNWAIKLCVRHIRLHVCVVHLCVYMCVVSAVWRDNTKKKRRKKMEQRHRHIQYTDTHSGTHTYKVTIANFRSTRPSAWHL